MSDIETAKPRNGLVDQGAHVIFLADVGNFAPLLAKATAAARPMPVKAPVINTTWLLIFAALPAEYGAALLARGLFCRQPGVGAFD
jgi:hypothetical protein